MHFWNEIIWVGNVVVDMVVLVVHEKTREIQKHRSKQVVCRIIIPIVRIGIGIGSYEHQQQQQQQQQAVEPNRIESNRI